MSGALIVGSTFGALVGAIHAAAVFRTRVSRAKDTREAADLAVKATAAYYAIWTIMLWVLFGSYVLYLWVIASIAYVGRLTWQRLQLPRKR